MDGGFIVSGFFSPLFPLEGRREEKRKGAAGSGWEAKHVSDVVVS